MTTRYVMAPTVRGDREVTSTCTRCGGKVDEATHLCEHVPRRVSNTSIAPCTACGAVGGHRIGCRALYLMDEALRLEYHTAKGAIAQARADERARIVAWLRGGPETLTQCDGHRHAGGASCWVQRPLDLDEAADAIERGEDRER